MKKLLLISIIFCSNLFPFPFPDLSHVPTKKISFLERFLNFWSKPLSSNSEKISDLLSAPIHKEPEEEENKNVRRQETYRKRSSYNFLIFRY